MRQEMSNLYFFAMMCNDYSTGGFYPVMRMPKQKPATSDFERKIADLYDFILQRVYPFFMWYGSITKSRGDELRSILFLEGLFLQMFVGIRDICRIRGTKLCNEHTDTFRNLLSKLNNEMRKGTKFIRWSNECLEEELTRGNSCIASMRQDLVEGFRELSGWFREEAQKPANREYAEALADELGLSLNYDMRRFGCTGDSFSLHTSMVLNGLILLALPSMPDMQTDRCCEMFCNSILDLQATKSWKWTFESWKKNILKAYEVNDIVENKERIVYLKRIWKDLIRQEQELLGRFNIMTAPTRSPVEKAAMGGRIYEHLNTESLEGQPRMSTNDLQQYFLYVSQKQWLDEEIDRLKRESDVAERPNPPSVNEEADEFRPFKRDVDLTLLKACINKVYCRFYVDEDRVHLEGEYNDMLTVMVYLYIICAAEGYLEETNKTAFYRFCVDVLKFNVK